MRLTYSLQRTASSRRAQALGLCGGGEPQDACSHVLLCARARHVSTGPYRSIIFPALAMGPADTLRGE
jgi:hypothetical protein